MTAALLCLAVSACTNGVKSDPGLLDRIDADLSRYNESVFTAAGLTRRYAGATTLDYSVQHGTQVEHMASDGRAYLWYPGNQRVVTGEWRTETDARGSGRICFRYGRSTFNPVTGQRGGSWNCVRAADFIWAEEEYTTGDPFGLSSGAIPFVMPREKKLTFKALTKPLGITVTPYL
ncbi:hypothetical protein K3725_03915 [Leisingera sp. S132]|uniref:hypothetical protein n=1 Tax=Leisingera sp. S132 TaxID=2867016 RepID=UPI0021A79EBD|nr:hypothetical protein [Leisingera sp. S132]UWQ80167.1 hypothetical protein K3725_03915 [Leisingera sp. S132]